MCNDIYIYICNYYIYICVCREMETRTHTHRQSPFVKGGVGNWQPFMAWSCAGMAASGSFLCWGVCFMVVGLFLTVE